MNKIARAGLLLIASGMGASACTSLLGGFDFDESTDGSGGSMTTGTGVIMTTGTGSTSGMSSNASGVGGMTTGSGGAEGDTTSSGSGGSSTGGSTSSSSSSSSSSASSGGMVCTVATDCPMPSKACIARLCKAGVCATGNLPADTPTATQVAGDCKQKVCDGTGDTLAVDDDTDAPTDNEVCTIDSCSGGVPVHAPAAEGTNCTAQGPAPKHVCGDLMGPNAGKCVECNEGDQCLGSKDCIMNVCQ